MPANRQIKRLHIADAGPAGRETTQRQTAIAKRGSVSDKLLMLQILRGIAASLVVLDHALLRHAGWNGYPALAKIAAQYSGTLGVTIFFAISGYIMIHTAGDKFGQPGAARDFLRKRIIRIVPLYWAATLLELALRLHKGGSFDLQQLLASLFFIPQPVPQGDYMRPLLGVGWTLNYEMFFYCIFAAALLFKRPAGLVFLFSVLAGLVALGTVSKPLLDTSPPHTLFGFWTDPVILLFAAGVAIGLIPKTAYRWAGGRHLRAIGVLILAYAAAFLLAVGSYPIPLVWQVGGWVLCILAVLVSVAERPARSGIAGRIGAQLGDISYALYLFHFFAIVAAEKVWWLLLGENPSILFILAAYLASVAAAFAIHHAAEPAIGRLLAPAKPSGARSRKVYTIRRNPSERRQMTTPYR